MRSRGLRLARLAWLVWLAYPCFEKRVCVGRVLAQDAVVAAAALLAPARVREEALRQRAKEAVGMARELERLQPADGFDEGNRAASGTRLKPVVLSHEEQGEQTKRRVS